MDRFDIIQYAGAAVHTMAGRPLRPTKRWDGSGLSPWPSTPSTTGYDVVAPQRPADYRERLYSGYSNAQICNDVFYWPLFVHSVGIDIGLAGSTANSRTTRDFYPHNFVQPSFVIQGQAIDQRDYGTFSDFVRYLQRWSLDPGPGATSPLIQLSIKGRGFAGDRTHGRGVTLNGKKFYNQKVRGPHRHLLCQGYITSMVRQHTQGVYAPTYNFGFVVADMIAGPYTEDRVIVQQQQNWVDILKSLQLFKVDQSLIKFNNQALKFAQKQQNTIISDNVNS